MSNANQQAQQGKQSQPNQLDRLRALKGKKSSNMTRFDGLVVVEVGVEPKAYFPKLKTADGATIKGPDGKDQRAEQPSGWTYTFTEFGTAKTVKIVLSQQYELSPLTVCQVSGRGYDIQQGNLVFIQEDGEIKNF